MLCELSILTGSFLVTWALLSSIALLIIFISSGTAFYFYYWPTKVSFEKWRYKSNPKYPEPEKVRDEIIQMFKGVICAAFCPTLSIKLAQSGYSKAFCGWNDYSLAYHVLSFWIVLIGSDFYEFLYHRLGHVNLRFWQQHKHHHVFYNPSPFAVIADEWVDQFFRSLPLLVLPLIMPINMDLMFFEYGLFFYFYGVYLHWGYEVEFLSAHNKYINTSFQHYCHHAKSLMNLPYHCGFYFKIWDQLFNCCYPEDKCFCAECARKAGKRTLEEYEKIVLQDYSKLFTSELWLKYFKSATR